MLVPSNNLNHKTNSFSSFDNPMLGSNILNKRKIELSGIISDGSPKGHYFNNKIYEDRQRQMHNKIWVT
jgi:hypothetical protein